MTPLGKMLAIFVFLLALVWAWLTVNTYVSRTNWKAEAEKVQKQAAALAKAYDELKVQVEAERVGVKGETDALRRENVTLAAKATAANEENGKLKTAILDEQIKANAANPILNKENARIQSLTTERDDLTKSVSKLQDERKDLTVETAKAKLAKEQAERDAAAQTQRAANLESRLNTKDDQLREALARLKAGVGEGVAVRPPAPEGFRGTVKAVSTSGEFVEITPGHNAGLKAGTRLTVKRYDLKNPANSRFVGYLTVRDEIDPDKAAAQFQPLTTSKTKKLSADDFPQPGDTVEPDLK